MGLAFATHAFATPVAVIYTYDSAGRITTALYDNATCVMFSYDANGNRTAKVVTTGNPANLTWGSGTWGCSKWSP